MLQQIPDLYLYLYIHRQTHRLMHRQTDRQIHADNHDAELTVEDGVDDNECASSTTAVRLTDSA